MDRGPAEIPFDLIAERLKALAEPSRLRLLHLLGKGRMNVSELVEATGLSQAGVSKHLRILRQEGLVVAQRQSRRVYYSLRSDLPRDICDLVCRSMEEGIEGGRIRIDNYWKAVNE